MIDSSIGSASFSTRERAKAAVLRCHRVMVLLPLISFVSLVNGAEYTHTVGDHTYKATQASNCFEISDHAVARCVEHFHEESEKELSTVFDNIRNRLVRDRQLLEETQAKWASFKSSECAVRSVSAQAFNDPEAQQRLFVKACVAELNAERIRQLKALSLGCDSCLQ